MPQVPTFEFDGPAVRERRLDLGLQQNELAEIVSCHPQTIRRIEYGRMKFGSELLVRKLTWALELPDHTTITRTRIAA